MKAKTAVDEKIYLTTFEIALKTKQILKKGAIIKRFSRKILIFKTHN